MAAAAAPQPPLLDLVQLIVRNGRFPDQVAAPLTGDRIWDKYGANTVCKQALTTPGQLLHTQLRAHEQFLRAPPLNLPGGAKWPVDPATITMRQRTLEWTVGFAVHFLNASPTIEVRPRGSTMGCSPHAPCSMLHAPCCRS